MTYHGVNMDHKKLTEETYLEKVYAGVLGKIIGVYLGRPFEGWPYERIVKELGDVNYYVHDICSVPLVVTDDDISGTFTFIRALEDYGKEDISAEQIGNSWLNYLVENRTVLWWGGLGNSTEHTAYLRLKHGIPAPLSGSITTNGKTVAEQIGAQIFIDGWAMVCPGDPEKAADLARRAASVSHDGEAIYGAQVIAAIESLAFIEQDLNFLLDTAVELIPRDSVIYRLIADLRNWRIGEPDWRNARERITAYYGYDRYGGNCHMIPNHALIHLGLLYGDDNFQKSLMITNTSGWDTDCNSGNIGCIMGIKNGLTGIGEEPDWRGPVKDRLYLPTADGGRCISDAVIETYKLVNIQRKITGQQALCPKSGARYHFELPGSMHGFRIDEGGDVVLKNVNGHSQDGKHSLKIQFQNLSSESEVRVVTNTFISPEDMQMGGYGVLASPALYTGQTIKARVEADDRNSGDITCRISISVYGANDSLEKYHGPEVGVKPGEAAVLEWSLNNLFHLTGKPIVDTGIDIRSQEPIDGSLYLDYLTWWGTPNVVFRRPGFPGTAWKKCWINGVDHFESGQEAFRLIQNNGRGLIIQGCREWADYQVSADVTPHMVKAAGIAGRVQGMNRYYAFLLCGDGKARLVKMYDLETVLAERNTGWRIGEGANLSLKLKGNHLTAYWDGFVVFDLEDNDAPITEGAIALVIEEGRTATEGVSVFPVE
jgi:ADP-ribosylglycohydrolase